MYEAKIQLDTIVYNYDSLEEIKTYLEYKKIELNHLYVTISSANKALIALMAGDTRAALEARDELIDSMFEKKLLELQTLIDNVGASNYFSLSKDIEMGDKMYND